ncbi:MAG: hypothetical protein HY978_00965 [Candidatus Liptonbacteria bacterium]|nr:hypothetical protein [Candidatus Liptonbacteria bacterium]
MYSKAVQNLISQHQRYLQTEGRGLEDTTEKIHVDEIAQKVATFYERVRSLIDYHEEHLLRKSTIDRILRRRVFLRDIEPDIAGPLIKELIRSGHLPNDTVSESKIVRVQAILDNLTYLLQAVGANGQGGREGFSSWLIKIFVPALEDELFPPPEERLLADAMYQAMKSGLVIRNLKLSESDADVQLYIGVQRALFRPDPDQLQYCILKFVNPTWGKLSPEELARTARELPGLRRYLQKLLTHRLRPYFYRLANRHKVVFQLIGDLVFNSRPINDDIIEELKPFYQRRYHKLTQQLNRLAIFSVISFFISKILVAVLIEVPVDRYLGHEFSLANMAINIIFPPLLMLLIIAFIRPPSRANFALVSAAVREVINPDFRREYILIVPKRASPVGRVGMRLAYLVTLGAVLYWIIKGLLVFQFSPASIVIFLLFTSMVIATGVKIDNRAKEISLEKEKATIFKFLVDLVTVPFMAIGKWTIAGLSRFNVLVIAFNFLLELPFQLFVEFLESFRSFIKSKKEEAS